MCYPPCFSQSNNVQSHSNVDKDKFGQSTKPISKVSDSNNNLTSTFNKFINCVDGLKTQAKIEHVKVTANSTPTLSQHKTSNQSQDSIIKTQTASSGALLYSKTNRNSFQPQTNQYIIDTKKEVANGFLGSLFKEQERLNSFVNFPSIFVTPADLAKAGFYYRNDNDKVICAFCKGSLECWQKGDIPIKEHRKHFPTCPFMLNIDVGNVEIPYKDNDLIEVKCASYNSNIDLSYPTRNINISNGILPIDKVLHPQYLAIIDRIKSFETNNFFLNLTLKDITELSVLGFYCHDNTTLVCYSCSVTVYDYQWEFNAILWNNVWCLHLKLSPECPHLVNIANNEDLLLITKCLENESINDEIVQKKPPLITNSALKFAITSNILRSRMDLPWVSQIIQMGYDRQLVETMLLNELKYGREVKDAVGFLEKVQDMRQQMLEKRIDNVSEILTQIEKDNQKEKRTRSNSSSQILNEMMKAELRNGKQVSTLHQELSSLMLCKICMDEQSSIALYPCGHMTMCEDCSNDIKICPICRKSVQATVKTRYN